MILIQEYRVAMRCGGWAGPRPPAAAPRRASGAVRGAGAQRWPLPRAGSAPVARLLSKKALSLRPPLSIIILIIILRLKELRGRRTRRVTGHGSANCHMRLTAGGETVQRALDRKRLDVEGARALGRLYTYGGGLGSVPPRCARTMPSKTVVHAFVEAFGRSAPRHRGAALAAFPARRACSSQAAEPAHCARTPAGGLAPSEPW